MTAGISSDGFNSYSWNARNQLASMNFSSNSFQYDAYGRRVGKTISSTTTNYLYDGANVAQELSGTTVTANLLSGGLDEIFTRTDSGGTANFLTDALGSTLALADGSGSILASYAYEPFGNTTVTSGSSANSYQYTGRENDGMGLYYYRARYYSTALQRFVSEDPLDFIGGGTDLYSYARNSPTYLTDPTGRNPILIIMAVGGALGAINEGLTAYTQGKSLTQTIDSTTAGFAAGATAAAVGSLTALGTANPALIGAASGLAYDVVLNKLEGNTITTGGAIESTASGAALGGLTHYLLPSGAHVNPDLQSENEAVLGGGPLSFWYGQLKKLVNPQSASANGGTTGVLSGRK